VSNVEQEVVINNAHTRLCRKSPSSARERAIFSPGKDGEAGDVCSIVDTAGCSQAEKGLLEARSSFPTEPNVTANAIVALSAIFASPPRELNGDLTPLN